MLPLLTLRAVTVDQEQSCKEISYQAADIKYNSYPQCSEQRGMRDSNCCMCLDSLNGWKSLASAMLNKEWKPRVPTANAQQSDLFEGFKSVVG